MPRGTRLAGSTSTSNCRHLADGLDGALFLLVPGQVPAQPPSSGAAACSSAWNGACYFRPSPRTTRLAVALAQACETATGSRVAAQWGLAPQTVRRQVKRVLRQWPAARPPKPLPNFGVDEPYLSQRDKFLTVVTDLERGEPLWGGRERKRETLDPSFTEAWLPQRRMNNCSSSSTSDDRDEYPHSLHLAG